MRWSLHTSSAPGMKLFASSLTFGSDQTDRLALTPLFHVQARGWPFITQSRIGLSSLFASVAAAHRLGRQSRSWKLHSSLVGTIAVNHCLKLVPSRVGL